MDLVLQICLLLSLGLHTQQYPSGIPVLDGLQLLRTDGVNPIIGTIIISPKDSSLFRLINWIPGVTKKPRKKTTPVTVMSSITPKPNAWAEFSLYDLKKYKYKI